MGHKSSISSRSERRFEQYHNVYVCDVEPRNRTKAAMEKINGVRYIGRVHLHGQRYTSLYFLTPREAALWVDNKRIALGLEPRNILKRVVA